jgi:aminoglycoside/choline kinase family phosphotransferase
VLGREPVAIEEIPAGLGRRRFFRVQLAGDAPSSLVARVESPEDPARRPAGMPPEPGLEPLRTFLEAAGIPVPQRYGEDSAAGIALLEDVGSRALRDVASRAGRAERRVLYEEACDLVPRLQRLHASAAQVPAFGRSLDAAFFAYKADFFVRWSLPVALGREARPAETAAVSEAFSFVGREAAAAPQRLAHRDLQGANVLVRPGARPGLRLVLIDLQGAFLAPPEYDLVCLLRDSYVVLDDDEVAQQLARVRPLLPDAPDPGSFRRRFDLLTLTRKGKDHALGFYHASLRDDRRELRFAARCARYLRAAAVRVAGLDPCLARFAELALQLPIEEPPADGWRPEARGR